MLAGHDDWPSEWEWQQVRQERDSKEVYFFPYARQRGVNHELSDGRKILAEQAARRYKRIRRLCQEDVAHLEGRIQEWIQVGGR